MFKNFSVSRHGKTTTLQDLAPSVADVQRSNIEQQLNRLNEVNNPNAGMTLAFPPAALKKLLPSFNTKAATIELDDVMQLIARNTKGTEFFAAGNPTLNRLTLQSQVQQIIASIKQERKK